MLNQTALKLGKKRSAIREIFEYARARAEEIGEENVFDFSLGNPSIPAPACVNETIQAALTKLTGEQLHGYTVAQGDLGCREKLASSISARFDFPVSADNLYLTCGAAACLTITFHALCNDGDEVVVIAPFFPEYREFIAGAGAKLVISTSDPKTFLPDFSALERAITPKTKAVLVNTPNNPSGVVYGDQTLKTLASLLKKKSEEYGHTVYLVSDEPYRELVYDDNAPQPFVAKYYPHTVVCYSYSKSLSLPGERIGYILLHPETAEKADVYAAICGAGRKLGFVCAPSLFQRVAAACDGQTGDLEIYRNNRDILYKALQDYGFECIRPQGAFYLLVKSPNGNAEEFVARAKEQEILIVPGKGFAAPEYARIAYCVNPEKIVRALPHFKKLAEEYGLC